ncbi:MAG: aspartate kinase [Chloroflexi bacterium GWB2_49_20]|nr:MAG: aspartate kinase [Chloroflexi bacterium GWB2_49_20]OGN77750.1 MAG: aspartate kinase [Chloroflexi bacterium GWC2_49_37]OGN86525.1 MAG: aspartate kinase [Chloroflexi bacterium GWD2_49_16]HBG74778.1 aspartate kinase [Anaerolineae bacterium]
MASTLVMKFGGTSVGSTSAIRQVIKIAFSARRQWDNVAVVVSAMSGVTDALLEGVTASIRDVTCADRAVAALREKHFNTLDELAPGAKDVRAKIGGYLDEYLVLCHAIHVLGVASPRILDAVSSLGELMSAQLVATALTEEGIFSVAVDTRTVVVTDEVYQSATALMDETTERCKTIISPVFARGLIPVLTGFIGATRQGITTTLGRGGSDISGAIFGVTLDADEIWIWTDVNGVMTADPRLVKAAHTIPTLTFREISELAFYGAKVLHPKAIRPVLERGKKLWVKNTFAPAEPGTLIVPDNGKPTDGTIRAVTAFKGQCIITVEGRGMLGVPGIAARTFGAVARTNTSVSMISQASSEQSICFVVSCSSRETVLCMMRDEFRFELACKDIDRISASSENAIITVVGAGMRHTPGIAGKIFSALGKAGVNVIAIAQGSSECSISLVVDSVETTKAVVAIHQLIT